MAGAGHPFTRSIQRPEKTLDLTHVVLDLIAKSLPYGDDVFKACVSGDPVATLRLLHYPHQTTINSRQLGAGAHTDFGFITLLLQDSQSSLQVYNAETGEWVGVLPVPGAYVVNVGDMLSMLTAGMYKSALHEAVNTSGTDRYPCPFSLMGMLIFLWLQLMDQRLQKMSSPGKNTCPPGSKRTMLVQIKP